MPKKPKAHEWDESLDFILGVGTTWGDVSGKVKTDQIGFIRDGNRKDRTINARAGNKAKRMPKTAKRNG